MPHLTQEHIEQFQALYLQRFNVSLSNEEALAKAMSLFDLVRVVLEENARNE